MPQIANRDQHEKALLAALLAIHTQALKDIEAALNEPPNASHVSETFWAGLREQYQTAIEPLLMAIYLDTIAAMSDQFQEPIDLTNEAEIWASGYTAGLVDSLIASRRAALADGIAKGREKGWALAEIIAALSVYFSQENANSITITESTTAISAAGQGYAGAYRILKLLPLIPVIRNDFDPCDECVDKQGKSPFEVGFSPFHPNCRCYEDWSLV